MSTIYTDSFHGDKGHTDGDELPLATAFQEVADDLNTVKPAAIAAVAVTDTAGGAYTATEQGMLNDLKALTTEMRTALNAVSAGVLKTINGGTR